MKRAKGLALIELLIVVAIIMIIAAIAIPNLILARDRQNFQKYFGENGPANKEDCSPALKGRVVGKLHAMKVAANTGDHDAEENHASASTAARDLCGVEE